MLFNMSAEKQFTVLHLGDDIVYNPDFYKTFSSQFHIVQPSLEERQRDSFIAALKERKWGDFHAVFRPFWNSGGEMGKWDQDLVPHLPKTCKIFASAGAGYDWADIPTLSEYGKYYKFNVPQHANRTRDYILQRCPGVVRSSR
jgi:hypothetical protein